MTAEVAAVDDALVLVRSCAAVFLPAQVPRRGRVALWRPDGGALPEGAVAGLAGVRGGEASKGGGGDDLGGLEGLGEFRGVGGFGVGAGPGPGSLPVGEGLGRPGDLVVARRHGKGARSRTVPAFFLPVGVAVPLLLRAARPHPTAACWAAAARHALHLAARGRLLPGLTAEDLDAWRAGPLDEADVIHLRAIAAALPAEAHAVPLPGGGPLLLPEPFALVRAFVDAVVDTLPRTPAAAHAVGAPFAAHDPQRLPGAREWAAEVAAGMDAGVRVSLRLDLRAHEVFDRAEEVFDRAEEVEGGVFDGASGVGGLVGSGVVAGAGVESGAAGGSGAGAEPGAAGGSGAGAGAESGAGGGSGAGGEVEAAAGSGVVSGAAAEARAEAAVPRAAVASPAAAVVQVHSLADPSLVTDVPGLWAGADHFGPRARVDTLLALRRAARVWPPLARLLERPRPDVLPLSEEELYDLLGSAAGRLGAAGVAVHWPRELTRGLTATAVVRPAPGTAADNFDFFKTEELLQFRWQLAFGDQPGDPLTDAELDLLAEAHRPVVRLRDQWVLVDPELVRKARKRDLGLLDPVDALSVALTGTAEVDGEQVPAVPVGALAKLRERVTDDLGTIAQPPGLHATLRDYQLRGLAWLDRMTSLGLGGCLADDMGLGKTITLIALHLHRAHPAPTLVVCPASLLGNWQREIERFAPGVPVRRFHGAGRTLAGLTGGFVLTTYATMRTSAPELAAQPWGLVVADEAQHVKNPHAATAKALRTIPSPARVALTGTPVENNLSELWALLDWTTPGLLGPLKAFRARHARLVEGGDPTGTGANDEALARLSRLVRPFLLRRKKSDPGIAPELPPKTETDHPVTLTREQTSLYEAVVRETLARIEASDGIARRGLVMKLLMALKQICNHPAQYLKDGVLTTRSGRARSGKLELLDELLDTILTESESAGAVLIFTQYVEMARLLETHLAARGIPTQLLHGGTPVARREEMVDRFQSGEVPVFLLSLKAAGTGLNLTRAGHVIHYDRWWNPAVEEQATDRAYRIGQTQPVQVHRLITEGTVEDRVAELLAAKRALADAVLGEGGESALTELSDAELADLVALRRTAT
ncbi:MULTISPECIES: DEAD/DEAH box helicase [Streptomyces]|uniref:DEAD/DEAH box helicase n=1 Tax=Streptomyces TaxID=1883 RepID=UPI001E4CF827|nr:MULTISPECIES: DEAD/DEAH box helicase [Streptomyces]UFQ15014.1 DEAD/DEAH box helicase [Streptomyces huasconensis]WCL84620.1 DEAD/DEAH box helicase [Streptomyces sp. JCM 35825]